MPPVRSLVLVCLLVAAALPSSAFAGGASHSGGTSADEDPSLVTRGPSGGASTRDRGVAAPDKTGALSFSRRGARPLARKFRVTPRVLREDRAPKIRFRIDQRGTSSVNARVVVVVAGTNRGVVSIDLGRVPTGRVVRVKWPRGKRLAPGRYDVRLHARDNAGATLARVRGATGKVRLRVKARPAPKPAPAPAPSPAPAPAPAPVSSGVFPVRGPYVISLDGGTFGADRGTHRHEGQDISAALGTPVVTPLSGTVAFVQNQPSGAGWYVVVNGDDGRSLFFAHLKTGSITVSPGQRVSAGTQIAQVGSTGSSTGPHLHFEIWEGGWRDQGGRPIDPLPQLRAWE